MLNSGSASNAQQLNKEEAKDVEMNGAGGADADVEMKEPPAMDKEAAAKAAEDAKALEEIRRKMAAEMAEKKRKELQE